MGHGVEPAVVFALASDLDSDLPAKAMTNALRQVVLDGPDFALNVLAGPLASEAREARCKLGGPGGLLPDERAFDPACLQRIGRRAGVGRFFWGFVRASEGRVVVRLHLWREGEGDRAAELPYDEGARDRVAARLYAKLVRPDKVGDLTVSGEASGELWVDGRAEGAYSPGLELTLPAGGHEIEVRQGPRVVARARAAVTPGGRAEAMLEPVAPPPSPPPVRVADPPPVTIRPKASAWPWVLGGTAAAGFAGAGAFYLLRRSELGDLGDGCYGRACPLRQQGAVDRADRYGTFAAISLGVGLAAGAGLATYALTVKRRPRVVGGAAPLAGGFVFGVGGAF
ncbi:MAG TPA: hypothetical protein VFS43_21675 [Polyangiaceae bacterium]|nr:hypothetical protein [Polyangiaceae bacterium]